MYHISRVVVKAEKKKTGEGSGDDGWGSCAVWGSSQRRKPHWSRDLKEPAE